jgi:hypothetical protein
MLARFTHCLRHPFRISICFGAARARLSQVPPQRYEQLQPSPALLCNLTSSPPTSAPSSNHAEGTTCLEDVATGGSRCRILHGYSCMKAASLKQHGISSRCLAVFASWMRNLIFVKLTISAALLPWMSSLRSSLAAYRNQIPWHQSCIVRMQTSRTPWSAVWELWLGHI